MQQVFLSAGRYPVDARYLPVDGLREHHFNGEEALTGST